MTEARKVPAVAPSYRMSAEAMQMHQELNCAATATDREGIAFLILTGEYIGFLPAHFAAACVNKGLLVPLLPKEMQFVVTLGVATRKARRKNLIVDRFLEVLLQDTGA